MIKAIKYILAALVFLIVLVGCGTQEIKLTLPDPEIVYTAPCSQDGQTVNCTSDESSGPFITIDGIVGPPGPQGEPGKSNVVLTIFAAPNKNECMSLGKTVSGEQLYGENEGNKGDFYNNDSCERGPDPYFSYCDNVNEDTDHCWAENVLLFTVGQRSEMQFYQLEFNYE